MNVLVETICTLCRLNFWQWDVINNKFEDFGYFGSSSAPTKSLEDFLNNIHFSDREKMREIFYQHAKNETLFEKVIQFQKNPESVNWIFIRGQKIKSQGEILAGIFIDMRLELMEEVNLNQDKVSSLLHELTQPLMVAKTYTSGCMHHLIEGHTNNKQLLTMMKKVSAQISLAGNKIHEMKNFK